MFIFDKMNEVMQTKQIRQEAIMRRDGDEKAARISEAKMVAMRRKQYAQA